MERPELSASREQVRNSNQFVKQEITKVFYPVEEWEGAIDYEVRLVSFFRNKDTKEYVVLLHKPNATSATENNSGDKNAFETVTVFDDEIDNKFSSGRLSSENGFYVSLQKKIENRDINPENITVDIPNMIGMNRIH